MSKSKWTILTSMAIVSMFFIGGCSQTNDITQKDSQTKSTHVYKTDEMADDSGLKITFKDSKYLKAEDKKTEVLQVNFELENTTVDKKGFTAIELKVKNSEGKDLEVYPGENYGKEILPGKKDAGSGYFTNEGTGPYTVTYTDESSKIVLTWTLQVEK